MTIRELAELIAETVGWSGELVFDTGKPDGMPRKLLDVSKLAGLGWTAGVDLREGLGRTYRSFLETVGTIPRVTAVETHDTRRTVLEPPGRWSALQAGRAVALPRAALHPRLARREGALQAGACSGAAWAVLQPLVMMGIFTLLFSRIANVPTGGVPYPVFAFAALVPWTLFASATAGSGASLVGQPEPGVEGLLPAARDPGRRGVHLGPGLRDRLGARCS